MQDNSATTNHTSSARAQPQAIAKLKSVTMEFGGKTVLDHIDLSVQAGKVLAILGPNGVGKTTLINLMLGAHQPTSGKLSLFNQPPGSMLARQNTGVMLQQTELDDTLTVRELIRQFCSYYPKALPVDKLVELAGLEKNTHTRYVKLSGGEKRRVQFAIALAGEPEILFLDEPTTGLDIEARQTLWANIRRYAERGAAVILTTHYLEEADALADEIVVLNDGQIVSQGSSQQIKQNVSLCTVSFSSDLDQDDLSAHPLVKKSIQGPNQKTVTLWTHQPENLLRELLTQDTSLSNLNVNRVGLEDAFLALTRKPDKQDSTSGAAA